MEDEDGARGEGLKNLAIGAVLMVLGGVFLAVFFKVILKTKPESVPVLPGAIASAVALVGLVFASQGLVALLTGLRISVTKFEKLQPREKKATLFYVLGWFIVFMVGLPLSTRWW